MLRIDIASLRNARGWTQTELAAKAAVSRATVNRIENGRQKSIDLYVLDKLAKALDVAPGLLIRE